MHGRSRLPPHHRRHIAPRPLPALRGHLHAPSGPVRRLEPVLHHLWLASVLLWARLSHRIQRWQWNELAHHHERWRGAAYRLERYVRLCVFTRTSELLYRSRDARPARGEARAAACVVWLHRMRAIRRPSDIGLSSGVLGGSTRFSSVRQAAAMEGGECA